MEIGTAVGSESVKDRQTILSIALLMIIKLIALADTSTQSLSLEILINKK